MGKALPGTHNHQNASQRTSTGPMPRPFPGPCGARDGDTRANTGTYAVACPGNGRGIVPTTFSISAFYEFTANFTAGTDYLSSPVTDSMPSSPYAVYNL